MMDRTGLVELREGRRLRRIDVAVRLGVDPTTVYLWESGRRRPNADNLLALADLYQVDPRSIRLPERRLKRAVVDSAGG